jgi:hypothetical protein
VTITDRLDAQTLPTSESFKVIRTANYGEVLRGVSFTPGTKRCGNNNGKKCDKEQDDQGGDHDNQGENQQRDQ